MKTDPQICNFGASILLKHLNAFQQEISGIRQGGDIEPIHRMRVASRRLRAAIPLFMDCLPATQSREWLRKVKAVTRALGAARDLDVQIEALKQIKAGLSEARYRPGMQRLILRFQQRRDRLQAKVMKTLDEIEKRRLPEKMAAKLTLLVTHAETGMPLPHLLYERSAAAIQARLDEFLSFEPYISRPECVTELHAMRIAAKKLRYTMEVFAPLYPGELQGYLQAVRAAQELLGYIHDCDVWLQTLPGFMESERQRTLEYYGHVNPYLPLIPGLRYFEENRTRERAYQYQQFQDRWAKWKTKGLWEQLRLTITAHLIPVVFPPSPGERSLSE